MNRFQVIRIEGDREPPFPLWSVMDWDTGQFIKDGCYASESAANRRAEREEENA